MVDTDLIERLDRDIQMAERARSEMIEQGHAGWPNAVLFLMETATEIRTQLIALRAECEGLRAAVGKVADHYEKSWGYDDDLRKGMGMQTVGQVVANDIRAALSQKETGDE